MNVVASGASMYVLVKISEPFFLTFFDNRLNERSGLTALTTAREKPVGKLLPKQLISLATEPQHQKGFHKPKQFSVFVENIEQDWICTLFSWNKLYRLGM